MLEIIAKCTNAFDRLDQAIFIRKLAECGLKQNIIDWIVSFLSHGTQCTIVSTKIAGTTAINLSIVQGSGVGPCLFIILVIDSSLTSSINPIIKYADDASSEDSSG